MIYKCAKHMSRLLLLLSLSLPYPICLSCFSVCTANLFIAQIAQLFGRWVCSKWLSFVFVSWKAATTAPPPLVPAPPPATTISQSQVKPQLTAATAHKNELQKTLLREHFSASSVQISRLANLFMACSRFGSLLSVLSSLLPLTLTEYLIYGHFFRFAF